MKNYLIHWLHDDELDGEFTLDTTWWKKEDHSIWAAVRAESEFRAEEIIRSSYSNYAYDVEFISITEQEDDWIPLHITGRGMNSATCSYSI